MIRHIRGLYTSTNPFRFSESKTKRLEPFINGLFSNHLLSQQSKYFSYTEAPMLELKNISKDYLTGNEMVHALQDVNLVFRNHEFVSILGPSGCGKTTLLNIIGGLDRPSDGELLINNISTKQYKEKDWNTYRNHTIGFVFQSYNLIPHQNALQNVELSLTLSGVSKHERRKRAKEALEKVGLGNQLKKKPAEMSGGQMQRVAIARALVNDPEIILADEPTGALDTETGIQIMDLMKKLANEHLVIMVTHNPDLAEAYSTRIIRMQDGKVLNDTAPVEKNKEQIVKENRERRHEKKYAGMSFLTAFGLSLKNLISKKGRTILTGFAGSIGIIGIAMIFAMSQGTSNYIDYVQAQTLTAYPITIEQQHVAVEDLLNMFMGLAEKTEGYSDEKIYQQAKLYQLVNAMNNIDMSENDLHSLKEFLDKKMEDKSVKNPIATVQYGYNINIPIYAKDTNGNIIHSDTQSVVTEVMQEYLGMDISQIMEMNQQGIFASTTKLMNDSTALWRELLTDSNGKNINDSIKNNYDIVYGHWPQEPEEVVLFISGNNTIDDISLYALGIKTQEELSEIMEALLEQKEIQYDDKAFNYEEICGVELTTIPSGLLYQDNGDGIFTTIPEEKMEQIYENGIKLKVVGIAKPNENSILSNDITYLGYLPSLRDMIGEYNNQSAVMKAQQENQDYDVLTGLPFSTVQNWNDTEKLSLIKETMEQMSEEEKEILYSQLTGEERNSDAVFDVEKYIKNMSEEELKEFMLAGSSSMGINQQMIEKYTETMSESTLKQMILSSLTDEMKEQIQKMFQPEARQTARTNEKFSTELLDETLAEMTDEELLTHFQDIVHFSENTLENNFITFGQFDKDYPSTVNIFATDFASKNKIELLLEEYNSTRDELQQIRYTDYIGLMMSSVTSIINAITYVLMAFVSVSLIVSSIMIGVITLISVQERTKEIGILRAMGASRRNVSSLFNAETIIVGFVAGAFGVGITYLLCIPINLILQVLTGMSALKAYLPPVVAIALILISMLLTLLAGIIPSRSAAKKDPVIALRTE